MKGKCTGFFGPTGSGKTTELNRIANEKSNNSTVSYVFQNNELLEKFSVLKNIIIPIEKKFPESQAAEIAQKWIKNLDLEDKTNELCSRLSGGEKQRVNLARAFAYDGNIFLLDEPFAAQDSKHVELIKKYINEKLEEGKNIYLVTHNLEDLKQLCQEIKYFPLDNQE